MIVAAVPERPCSSSPAFADVFLSPPCLRSLSYLRYLSLRSACFPRLPLARHCVWHALPLLCPRCLALRFGPAVLPPYRRPPAVRHSPGLRPACGALRFRACACKRNVGNKKNPGLFARGFFHQRIVEVRRVARRLHYVETVDLGAW